MKQIFIASFLLLPLGVLAQGLPEQGENYFNIVANHVTDNDSVSEGSSFNAFRKWQAYWGPRLYPHGNFHSYINTWSNLSVSSSSGSLPDPNWQEVGPTTEMSSAPTGATVTWVGDCFPYPPHRT